MSLWIVIGSAVLAISLVSLIVCWRNWQLLPIAAILLAMGSLFAIFLYSKVSTSYRNAAAQSWPTTRGEILKSSVSRSFHSEDDGGYYTYRPDVVYSYEADGRRFTANRITTSDLDGDFQYAHPEVLRYPVGKVVKVYFDPESPEFAILEPGNAVWQFSLFEIIIASGVMLVVGVIVLGIAYLGRVVNRHGSKASQKEEANHAID